MSGPEWTPEPGPDADRADSHPLSPEDAPGPARTAPPPPGHDPLPPGRDEDAPGEPAPKRRGFRLAALKLPGLGTLLGRERHEAPPDRPPADRDRPEPESGPAPRPRPAARPPLLGLKREARVGIAALLSFVVLVAALVVKKGWVGKAVPLAINANPGDPPAEQDGKPPEGPKIPESPRKEGEPTPPVPTPAPNPPLPRQDKAEPPPRSAPADPPAPPARLADEPKAADPAAPPALDPAAPEMKLASNDLPPAAPPGSPEPPPGASAPPPVDVPTAPADPLPLADGQAPASPAPAATPAEPAPTPPPAAEVAAPPAGVPEVPPAPKSPEPAPAEPARAGPPTGLPSMEPSPAPPVEPAPAPAPVPPEPSPLLAPEPAPPAPRPEAAAPVRAERAPTLESVPTAGPAAEPSAAALGAGWVVVRSGGKRVPGVGIPAPAEPAGPAARNAPRPREESVDDQADLVVHTVQPGENFWTISQTYYRSGRYYKALHAANGRRVPKIDELYVGTVLRIPPPEALDRALILPATSRPKVADEPTGSKITRTSRRDDPAGGIELALPPRPPVARPGPEVADEPQRPTYTVRAHDTLRSIARQTLNDSGRDREILNLNREVIDDPKALAVGTTLVLPEDAVVGRKPR